jgi:hypothetical protein
MRRTELIPQTTAAINSGKVWYHFSMMKSTVNPPSIYREHQINFFESHFTEMKAGWISGESGTSDAQLRWDVSSTTHWNTTVGYLRVLSSASRLSQELRDMFLPGTYPKDGHVSRVIFLRSCILSQRSDANSEVFYSGKLGCGTM